MVWHIFRKDWKLLWRMAVGVALIGLVYRVIHSSVDPFANGRNTPMLNLLFTLGEIALLGIGLVVLMVAQQDAIPGLRQDWLVRPIGRTDLLLSKLAFVVLAVQLPIFVIEVGQGLASGFPLGQSLSAPFGHSLTMLFALELPVLAFATLTRNLTEAIGGAVVATLVVALFATASIGWTRGETPGVPWVTDELRVAWGLFAAAIVLAMQYYRRKTTMARAIGGCALMLWLFAMLLPWSIGFAVQERFSPEPGAAKPVRISFEPGKSFERSGGYPELANTAGIYVPLRIGGAANGRILMIDRLEARLKSPNGEIIDLGRQLSGQRFLEQGQRILVPKYVYNRVKDQPTRLQMDYSLTLLKANADESLPAMKGNRMIPDAGWCATRVNFESGSIELRCTVEGNAPCATWYLRNPATGQHGGEGSGCASAFAPWVDRIDGDSTSRFGGDLGLRDFPRSVPGVVNETQLKEAQVMVRVYRPEAHFTRQVVIPDIRLGDWRVR